MKVKIKKLHPDAVIPKKAHSCDSGFDLVAVSESQDKGYAEYGTGLAFSIPKNHVGLIFPRSSISNVKMSLTNSVGVIDSNYFGEVRFRFKPTTTGNGKYNIGDRVGQLIIIPYPEIEFEEVDELGDSERGKNGFGSSGV